MSMKKVFTCNICNEITEPKDLIGVHFSNIKDFTLDAAHTTDGTHICILCATQLKKELNGYLPHLRTCSP